MNDFYLIKKYVKIKHFAVLLHYFLFIDENQPLKINCFFFFNKKPTIFLELYLLSLLLRKYFFA